MRWFALKVAYDGTDFGGWQYQVNSISIQQRLMEAIVLATGESPKIMGSGRTDSGVHATGQIVSMKLENWRAPADRLILAINRNLPRSIVVRSVEETVEGFDPIRHATRKRYRYDIWNSRVADPMLHPFHWWLPRPLNVDRMRHASEFLLGTHDFKAFETLGSPRKTSVRTIFELSLTHHQHLDGTLIHLEVEADGFLYNMVRNIVGALVAVGAGRFPPRWVATVLNSLTRDASSQTAPARGLFLVDVRYPDHLFLDRKSSG